MIPQNILPLIFWLIAAAVSMAALISAVLTRAVKAKTGVDVAIVLVLLAMMVAMLVGPAYLFLTTPGFGMADVVIWEIAVFMGLGMMPLGVLLAVKLSTEGDAEAKGRPPLSNLLDHPSALRLSYIFLLVFNEFLMGWTFNLASGVIPLSPGHPLKAITTDLGYSLITYWFVFTMVAEMGLTLFALRKRLRSDLLTILVIQGVAMFLTPTALSSQIWETYTVYLEAAAMTGLIVFALDHLRSKRERHGPTMRYLGLFIVANAVMMAGFLLWLVDGDTLVLALSLVAETVVYFDAVFTGAGMVEALRRDGGLAQGAR